MPNITVRNIPDELYERLKAAAKRHHRSINGEILDCLERRLRPRRLPAEEILSRARVTRERLGGGSWTVEEIQAAIDEGRRRSR